MTYFCYQKRLSRVIYLIQDLRWTWTSKEWEGGGFTGRRSLCAHVLRQERVEVFDQVKESGCAWNTGSKRAELNHRARWRAGSNHSGPQRSSRSGLDSECIEKFLRGE